jgi:hypothetical protein
MRRKRSPKPNSKRGAEKLLENRLRELEAQGLIKVAKRPIMTFKAIPSRGKPASRMITEDRR